MKIFFDTEFLEDGKTIELISIGMVREDGKTLYRESTDFDVQHMMLMEDSWLRTNVWPYLLQNPVNGFKEKPERWHELASRKQIAEDILAFVGDAPEFWAYYADYDWVVLCQLYGRMVDLPKNFPMHCRDLKQFADMFRVRLPKQSDEVHHALVDALWVKKCFEQLQSAAPDMRL